MKTVIFCGGQGTRLKEETEFRPKPMVEIGGKPILWHIMKHYAHFGFRKFVLCLGYKGNMIKEYFLNYAAMNHDLTIDLGTQNRHLYHGRNDEEDFEVTLADTGLEAMTGARLKAVQKYVDADLFMATYGDGLSDLNIRSLVEFHQAHGRLATVTVVRPISRFGMVQFDTLGRVFQFAEKPLLQEWVSAGFFVFNRQVFDYLSIEENSILEREPLEKLAQENQLVAFPHEGFFFAMDTYREFSYLNEQWNSGAPPWAIWRAGGANGNQ